MLHDTTKYDGSLHYRFPVEPLRETENSLVFYRSTDVDIVSYRGCFPADGHLLGFCFNDRYHNVMIIWNRDWSPRIHYVNIATPAQWDRERMTAVDMDLDVFRHFGDSRVVLDDEHEFEEHRQKFGYPQMLVEKCREEARQVSAAVRGKHGLFSDRIFDWRPGSEPYDFIGV